MMPSPLHVIYKVIRYAAAPFWRQFEFSALVPGTISPKM